MKKTELKNNILLIGFMGAGKSTIGRVLAKKIKFEYIDIDRIIEHRCARSITEIFDEHGEEYFRDKETETLESLAGSDHNVYATGGGIVLKERNWPLMRELGPTVYLEASLETLWDRIKHDKRRPLLQVDNAYERAGELLSKRKELYEKADLILCTENRTPDEIAEMIIDLLTTEYQTDKTDDYYH